MKTIKNWHKEIKRSKETSSLGTVTHFCLGRLTQEHGKYKRKSRLPKSRGEILPQRTKESQESSWLREHLPNKHKA